MNIPRTNYPQCVASTIGASTGQLNIIVVSSYQHLRQVTQRARCREMDKVMKRLGIEITEIQGKDVKPIFHYNLDGRPIGGNRNNNTSRVCLEIQSKY